MDAAWLYAINFVENRDKGHTLSLLRNRWMDFELKQFQDNEMNTLRKWYRIWLTQGFPINGLKWVEKDMKEQLQDFNTMQEGMFKQLAPPSDAFTLSALGTADKRIEGMDKAIDAIFTAGSTNTTIYDGYSLVRRNWIDFSREFKLSFAASKNRRFPYIRTYKRAKKSLESFEPDDSVKGLITFLMNRVSWSGDLRIEEATMKNYEQFQARLLMEYFIKYQERALKNGAKQRGYLTEEEKKKYYQKALELKKAQEDLWLNEIDDDEFAMDLAKRVQQGARL